jgi:hypothetical protein
MEESAKHENPYRPGNFQAVHDEGIRVDKATYDQLEDLLGTNKLIKRGLTTIALSAVMFGVVGGLIGWVLGLVAPQYYRIVFDAADQVDFSPQQVGFGLGLTQGLLVGALVGCVAVLAAAIYKSRMRPIVESSLASNGMS